MLSLFPDKLVDKYTRTGKKKDGAGELAVACLCLACEKTNKTHGERFQRRALPSALHIRGINARENGHTPTPEKKNVATEKCLLKCDIFVVVVVPSPPLRRSLSSPRQLFIVGVRKHSLCELYQLPRSCAVSMATSVKGRGLICQANQRGRDFKIKARNVTGRRVFFIYIYSIAEDKRIVKRKNTPKL